MPGSLWKGRARAAKTLMVATSIKTSLQLHHRRQWAPGLKRVSPWPGWATPLLQIIPRGVMATQVSAAPAGKIRWNVEPVGVPAGVRYCHHSSRWKHRCDGNILSCGLIWTCPDLAHEPHPRVSLLLRRALCAVRCELRQCLPAARCGGPPPCGEAGARGDSPEVHLPLHQGARYYTSYF
jgi:hypothetical protein